MSLAPAYLFFGCRKSNSDFIYKDEIFGYKEQGIITDCLVALSREQGREK
jgi:sulfite reductase alpha subunit-like flavoprotein